MEQRLKLPVGIEFFDEIRTSGYYYIDKTKLIEQLLQNMGKVSLFTRPRRFGKTLNMSMLKCFFEIGTAPALFDGLYISGNKELCDTYMGKYPVIFLSHLQKADRYRLKMQIFQLLYRSALSDGILLPQMSIPQHLSMKEK